MARVAARLVTVPFTIPGERVEIRLAGSRAMLLSVVKRSPHRVEAPCPHFGLPRRGNAAAGLCGGCTWQHIAYAEQLRLKTALVDRLVRAAVADAPAVAPTLPSTPADAPWGYRHKVHFAFADERADEDPRRSTLVMGHYIRGSKRVLPVRQCAVHDPRGNDVAFEFYAAFKGARVEAERGGLRSLAVRVGAATGEISATLVVSKPADKRVREATRKAISRQGLSTSVHVNLHDRADAYIFGRDTRRLTGPERMRERVAGISFLVSPTVFFQTNVHAAEILVRLISAQVPSQARVLDLYAGCGLFALPLARAGCTVTAVEENRAAVADGRASARLNRIPEERCRFVASDVVEAVSRSSGDDVVILDPPREGCEPSVLRRVFGALRPKRAIYVSCNPDALARDLRAIAVNGYVIRSLQPVDMFPHTAHVETVAVLDRAR